MHGRFSASLRKEFSPSFKSLTTIFEPQLRNNKEKIKYLFSLLDKKLNGIIVFNNFDKE